MLTALLKKIHFFIIAYTAYTAYEDWTAHELKYESTKAKIPGKEVILKKKIKDRDQLNSYFADVEAAKKRITVVAAEIEKLQQQLPAKISDTENLDLLSKTSTATNIKDVFLSPGREELRGFYFAKKYKYKATATYLQFLIFFEKLALEERILNINNVVLTQSNTKQRGRFRVINAEVEIEAYRYNSNFREDTGIKSIDNNKTAPTVKKRKKR